MARLIVMKCPKCEASIQLDPDQRVAFCSYCGTQLLFDNEREYTLNNNSTVDLNVTYHEIDEAAIKRAEADMRRSDVKMAQVAASVKEAEIINSYKSAAYKQIVQRYTAKTKLLFVFGSILAICGAFCVITAFAHVFPEVNDDTLGVFGFVLLGLSCKCFFAFFRHMNDFLPISSKIVLDNRVPREKENNECDKRPK